MGYTHYWRFKINPAEIENGKEKFKEAVDLVRHFHNIVTGMGIDICGWNGDGEPKLLDDEINFNGKEELCHENCHIKLNMPDKEDWEFNFCKTAEKPYDLLVCLTLMAFKHCFGDDFNYSSDGVTRESIQDPANIKYWEEIHWEPEIEIGWQQAYDIWDSEMGLA